jgi:hypothetical protein
MDLTKIESLVSELQAEIAKLKGGEPAAPETEAEAPAGDDTASSSLKMKLKSRLSA